MTPSVEGPLPQAATTRRPDHDEVVGRDEDLERIRGLVLDPARLPAACVLTGAAGSGKTTVLRSIVDEAREQGRRVAFASGSEAEWQLSLGAVRDLVGGDLESVERDLPVPQRRLLRVMLLLDEPHDAPPDPGGLAVAFLGFLRALAARDPLLIAIDDVQWLDAASRAILSYALRRLSGAPVGVLLTQRDGPPGSAALFDTTAMDRALTIRLGPLSIGALGAILRAQLGRAVGRPTLRRIHDAAADNPLLAVELARVLTDPEGRSAPGAPLPVPASIPHLIRSRLEGLDRVTLDALGVLAALASQAIDLPEAIPGRDLRADLGPAVDAGIIDIGAAGARFRHPLLASLAYELLGPTRQRQTHRRLGALLSDPEERARHVALGVQAPDAAAAAVVEAGARTALGRGSPSAAADLAFHSVRITPPDDLAARRRRAIIEIDGAFAAGETARAATRLDELLAASRPGPDRADLLARQARLQSFAGDIPASVEGLRDALTEAGGDDALRAEIEEKLAWGLMLIRRDVDGAVVHARSAADLARRRGDPAVLAESLATQALAECLTGRPWSVAIHEALALETAGISPGRRRPGFAHGCCLTCVGDLAGARTVFEGLAERAIGDGDEALLPSIRNRLARVELQAGRWDAASRHIDDGLGRAQESGHGPSTASLRGKRAVLAARRGDHERARADAREALALAIGGVFDSSRSGDAVARGGESALWALGHVAISELRPEAALEVLEPMTSHLLAAGVREPGEMPWLADLAEALILVGRVDAAIAIIERFEHVEAAPTSTADAATVDRLRGLIDAARGDHRQARDRFMAAQARHDGLDLPFEAALTDLALGGAHRRLREHRAARTALEAARARFASLGAAGWERRAVAELARIGGRAPARDGLTPTERSVAELVARGRTNREAAAALYLSVHTVEAALTAVYGKLGVRSRTELARRIDDLTGGNS